MLSDKQRDALIGERGEPRLRLEFDVFADGQISMWTHFDHGGDFNEVKEMLAGIQKHLTEFIADESMCPFHGVKRTADGPVTRQEFDHALTAVINGAKRDMQALADKEGSMPPGVQYPQGRYRVIVRRTRGKKGGGGG